MSGSQPDEVGLLVENKGSGSANVQINVAEPGTGDPISLFTIGNQTPWGIGVDRSDGSTFAIFQSASGTVANVKLAIDTAGNVGIGRRDAQSRLAVQTSVNSVDTISLIADATAPSGGITLKNTGGAAVFRIFADMTNNYTRVKSQGVLALHAGNVDGSGAGEVVTVVPTPAGDTAGRVGIGQPNPTTRLDVNGGIHAVGEISSNTRVSTDDFHLLSGSGALRKSNGGVLVDNSGCYYAP